MINTFVKLANVTIHSINRDSILTNTKVENFISSMPIFIPDDVFFLEILGKGGFGLVQKAYHKKIDKFVALKTFLDLSEDSFEQIRLEDALLFRVETINKSYPSRPFLEYSGASKSTDTSKYPILQMESGMATLDDVLKNGMSFEMWDAGKWNRKPRCEGAKRDCC